MVDFSKPDEPGDASAHQPQQPPHAQPQAPVAGWYVDPELPGQQRWWDGTQWTENRQPLAAPGAQASAPFGAAPGPGPSPFGGPQPAPGQPVPPGPAYGQMSAAEERNWAIGAHLSALVAAWAALGVLGPLVVYLVKKDESPWVRAHAAAALNFQLSWLIWGISLSIATFLLLLVFIGFFLIPVLVGGAIWWLVLVILATIGASRNEQPYKYPLTIDFVR